VFAYIIVVLYQTSSLHLFGKWIYQLAIKVVDPSETGESITKAPSADKGLSSLKGNCI